MAHTMLMASSLATLIVAGVSPAAAFWQNGNQLQDQCQKPKPVFAFGYIWGLLDGQELAEQGGATRQFCLPDDLTGTQLFDVVCRFVEAHPNQRHVPASYLATAALKEAWPCPQKAAHP